MNADDGPATLAAPSLVFFLDKRSQSRFTNEREVLNHAHAVLRSVALVQVSQSSARVLRALIAESRLRSFEQFAVRDAAAHA